MRSEAEKRTRRAMTLREARSGWATVQVPDLAALLAEIDRLRAAVQHESDCVEAAKEEVEALRADAERLSSIAYPPFCDEYNEVDLHEQAAIYASAFGREEPNRDDYLAALRDAVDAALAQAKEKR